MASSSTIAIASDHAGFELKRLLVEHLEEEGHVPLDLGCHSGARVDYPDMAQRVVEALREERARRGVLICGTGIGIAMAANRAPHVRAAVCHDTTSARLARAHNNANVMALGARLTGSAVAIDCLKTFLATAFDGGRHEARVRKLG